MLHDLSLSVAADGLPSEAVRARLLGGGPELTVRAENGRVRVELPLLDDLAQRAGSVHLVDCDDFVAAMEALDGDPPTSAGRRSSARTWTTS